MPAAAGRRARPGGAAALTARSLHQFVAGFNHGDAISNEALLLRRFARDRGLASDIYCEPARVLPELRREVRDVARAEAELGPEDAVLLHLSIGSVVNEIFWRLRTRRAILYHNVTPPEWFEGLNEATARLLALGLQQARQLAGTAQVTLADSAFNAGELAAMGHRDVKIYPLALDFSQIRAAPDPTRLREWADGRTNLLFVGRGAPNKRIEDLLAVLHYVQRWVEPAARLIHVGSFAGTERYLGLLQARAREWRLRDVVFAGPLPQRALSAAYAAATAFVCMSEHEGFCVPLVEAMAHGVPVVAYAAGAVPETLDGAGVLFRQKRWDLIAETIGRLARDPALRRGVQDAQRRRLERFERRDAAAELFDLLRPLLG